MPNVSPLSGVLCAQVVHALLVTKNGVVVTLHCFSATDMILSLVVALHVHITVGGASARGVVQALTICDVLLAATPSLNLTVDSSNIAHCATPILGFAVVARQDVSVLENMKTIGTAATAGLTGKDYRIKIKSLCK